MLTRITIPSSIDQTPMPEQVADWVERAKSRIEAFQDRWDRPQIEQFVAADYEFVFQNLAWILESQPLIGRRFLEWGCGFAVVSVLASWFELDAIGIEAEMDLLTEGRQTILECQTPVELVHGNFLPPGAEALAHDPTLPSLGHDVDCAYDVLGIDVDDFAIIYAYPWPGEDDFHEAVFDRFAARGALLILFQGPHDVRVYRKS